MHEKNNPNFAYTVAVFELALSFRNKILEIQQTVYESVKSMLRSN